jgi:hypothetical protein
MCLDIAGFHLQLAMAGMKWTRQERNILARTKRMSSIIRTEFPASDYSLQSLFRSQWRQAPAGGCGETGKESLDRSDWENVSAQSFF